MLKRNIDMKLYVFMRINGKPHKWSTSNFPLKMGNEFGVKRVPKSHIQTGYACMYVNISILYVYCRQPILSLHVPDNETRILEIFSLPITEINVAEKQLSVRTNTTKLPQESDST